MNLDGRSYEFQVEEVDLLRGSCEAVTKVLLHKGSYRVEVQVQLLIRSYQGTPTGRDL